MELELTFNSQESWEPDSLEGRGGDSEEIEIDYTTDPSLEEANKVIMRPSREGYLVCVKYTLIRLLITSTKSAATPYVCVCV